MKKRMPVLLSCGVLLMVFALHGAEPVQAGNSSLGMGVHYNVLSGDIDDIGLDSDYFSYVLSLRQRIRPNLRMEFAVDYYPGKNEIDHVIRPFAALVWGDLINFGAGVTRSYIKHETEGSEWSDLSYQVQAGVQFPLGHNVDLNLDAFYFLQEFDEITDINLKNLTFAARLFFRF